MNSKFRNATVRTALAALIAGALIPAGAGSAAAPGAAATPIATTAAAAESQQKAAKPYNIVVIGDSLAAGYELGHTIESVPYGYGEHVYEQALLRGYRTKYDNYGMLGLKSKGLRLWLEAAENGRKVTEKDIQESIIDPRVDALLDKTGQMAKDIKGADLILISIGGNDFGALITEFDSEKDYAKLTETRKKELDARLQSLIAQYEEELSASLKALRRLQPKAQVIVANQYLPIPSRMLGGKMDYSPFSEATYLYLKSAQSLLHERLDSLADSFADGSFRVEIADASSVIEKDVGKHTSVMNPGQPDIHPKRAGYAALGEAYAKQLWGNYIKLQPRAADVPLSVVVDGKEVLGDYPAVLNNDRTFLPIREVANAMGAELDWDNAAQTATFRLNNKEVQITVGSTTLLVNGKQLKLNADPAYFEEFVVNNKKERKTYVPLAALSEGLGFQVVYRSTLKAAIINR